MEHCYKLRFLVGKVKQVGTCLQKLKKKTNHIILRKKTINQMFEKLREKRKKKKELMLTNISH